MVERAQIEDWLPALRDKAISAASQLRLPPDSVEDVAQGTFQILLDRAAELDTDRDRILGYVWTVAFRLALKVKKYGPLGRLIQVDSDLFESLLEEPQATDADQPHDPEAMPPEAEQPLSVLELLGLYVKQFAATRFTQGQRYRALRNALLVARCYLREKPIKQAAEELGLNPDTAGKALKKTLKQLERFFSRRVAAANPTTPGFDHFRTITELSQFLRAQLALAGQGHGT